MKVPKTMFHVAADFFTIGLWEVVGTPAEILMKQDALTYVVSYDDENRARCVTVLGKKGAIEQTGTIGAIGTVPVVAAAVGSRLTPDLDRQALLSAIAERHAQVVTHLEYRPWGGKASVTVVAGADDARDRALAYAEDLCTADEGLIVKRRASEAPPRFQLEEVTARDGQTTVRFRCKQ